MKRGVYDHLRGKLDSNKGKPIILGISSGKRAKEDPVSLYYLKLALKEEKNIINF